MRKTALVILAVAAVCGAAGSAQAQMALEAQSSTVIGSYAQSCYEAAKAHTITPEALTVCDRSLAYDLLSGRDRSATHINRGILYLARKQANPAVADFDEALKLTPGLGEAYANRGAALVLRGTYAEAIDNLTRSLDLKTAEPHKAYYNRALAKEMIDDIRGAYADFMQAQSLKPEWDFPARELARYTVRTRTTAQ